MHTLLMTSIDWPYWPFRWSGLADEEFLLDPKPGRAHIHPCVVDLSPSGTCWSACFQPACPF